MQQKKSIRFLKFSERFKKRISKQPLRFHFQRPLDFFILDIYCMSIFNFLEKMFFGRTEKSGNQNYLNCRTEMNAKPKTIFTKKKQKYLKKWKIPLK